MRNALYFILFFGADRFQMALCLSSLGGHERAEKKQKNGKGKSACAHIRDNVGGRGTPSDSIGQERRFRPMAVSMKLSCSRATKRLSCRFSAIIFRFVPLPSSLQIASREIYILTTTAPTKSLPDTPRAALR
jgi:hypothetical protein